VNHPGELRRLLAEPVHVVVILAETQAHTVSAGWQVLESNGGAKHVVVIDGSQGGDGHSTSRQ